MALIRSLNLTVAFLLELCLLAALGYWGFTAIQGWPRMVLGLVAPLLAAIVWGMFLAPKASRPLDPVLTFWLKGAMLALGVVALVLVNRPKLAVSFAVAIALNMLLLWRWRA